MKLQFKKLSLHVHYLLWVALIGTTISCKEEPFSEIEEETETPAGPEEEDNSFVTFSTGWTGEDNLDQVPVTTNFGFASANLPSSVDLTNIFPPMGDQGQYGTCVTWAVAYNVKSALNGMSQGLSGSQLASPANQFSPKDLFLAIPDDQKAPDCNGTNFSYALNVLQNRGVATMQTVPYTNLNDCGSYNLQPSWDNEAQQNKIKYWRKIDPTITSIKQNLSDNIPVILGARLSDNFMTWNSDNVISSSTTYINTGIHGYHAMVIAGYDNSKGPNGAFRVINSWGDRWGDRGYIWIDYNYMIEEFCTSSTGDKPLLIAADEEGDFTPQDDSEPLNPVTTGVDLAPWIFSDYSAYQSTGVPNERIIDFNIYNIGGQSASARNNWSFYYLYFNPWNINEYGVIFYDHFNTTESQGSFNCPASNHCVFNYDIPSGGNFTQSVWGLESQTRNYYMPEVTGYYYLVMFADAEDAFQETNEQNNQFYTTVEPMYFQSGYASRTKQDDIDSAESFRFSNDQSLTEPNLSKSKYHSIVNRKHPNAYTQKEIEAFLANEYQAGRLQEKIQASVIRNAQIPYAN